MLIYVSNLGCHVESADLNVFFTAFGAVTSARVITDKETGKSLRYGFVEMPDEKCASEAISKLHGKTVEGRTMSVSFSKPKGGEKQKQLFVKSERLSFANHSKR